MYSVCICLQLGLEEFGLINKDGSQLLQIALSPVPAAQASLTAPCVELMLLLPPDSIHAVIATSPAVDPATGSSPV